MNRIYLMLVAADHLFRELQKFYTVEVLLSHHSKLNVFAHDWNILKKMFETMNRFKNLGRELFVVGKRVIGRILGRTLGKILWRLPGLQFVVSLIYNELKPLGPILVEVQGNKMTANTNDRDIGFKLLADGFQEEKYETEVFKKKVREGMVVVDVGANIGYYSLIAAKLVGKSGIVYAFEPMLSNYALLCKNIEINSYINVVPIQKAVSNKTGKSKLWYEKDWSGSPSFWKECALTVSHHKSLEKGGFVEVETIALDEFLRNQKVDIIKIDAEGAEGLILDGAKRILKSNYPLVIFMEFWPDALRNLGTNPIGLLYKLQEYGFKICFINEKKQKIEPIDYEKAKAGPGFNLLLEKCKFASMR